MRNNKYPSKADYYKALLWSVMAISGTAKSTNHWFICMNICFGLRYIYKITPFFFINNKEETLDHGSNNLKHR